MDTNTEKSSINRPWAARVLGALDPAQREANLSPPKHSKTDKVPVMSSLSANAWVFLHFSWPIFLQRLYTSYSGHNPSTFAVFALYLLALQINSIKQISILHRLGLEHGYLDGDQHSRDEVPDSKAGKVFTSLQLATAGRPLLALFFAYQKDQTPSLSLLLPIQLAFYSIILDFWFYVYQRACHEIDGLWKYHRTHHLTKHPNPLLTIFADPVQEMIEIALLPLLTWLSLKPTPLALSFYDWFVCNGFVMFSELFGHSGLRVHYVAAGTASYVLKPFQCELIVEDHDLHHRRGWRRSGSYGKQTRLWDRLFGTLFDRVEMLDNQLDYGRLVNMPLF